MVKITLLNDGGYIGFDHIKFPVTVDATPCKDNKGNICGYYVSVSELNRIGHDGIVSLVWLTGSECEVSQ